MGGVGQGGEKSILPPKGISNVKLKGSDRMWTDKGKLASIKLQRNYEEGRDEAIARNAREQVPYFLD